MGEIGHFFNIIFTFPIFNLLMGLYYLFNDFGLSIVVLTIIIKLILYPLTAQQLKSMKAQRDLQGPMAELKKKYAGDPQTLQRETMALYKEAGINPVAGCLPLLVQLPVLYGMFFAINGLLTSTTQLNNAQKLSYINDQLYAFMPHFTTVPDLNLNWFTFLNPAWHISLTQPDPTHILPILAGIATFIQLRMSIPATPKDQKESKKKAASATPDPSAQTAQMMQFMMPVMTVVFGWTFAAGLALYWTVSYLFQVLQQFFLTKSWGALAEVPDFLNFLKASPKNSKQMPQVVESTLTSSERERTYTRYERKAESQNAAGAIVHEGDENSSRGPGQYNRRQRKNVSRQRRSQRLHR